MKCKYCGNDSSSRNRFFISVLANAILEMQKHGQLCPDTIKQLQSMVDI